MEVTASFCFYFVFVYFFLGIEWAGCEGYTLEGFLGTSSESGDGVFVMSGKLKQELHFFFRRPSFSFRPIIGSYVFVLQTLNFSVETGQLLLEVIGCGNTWSSALLVYYVKGFRFHCWNADGVLPYSQFRVFFLAISELLKTARANSTYPVRVCDFNGSKCNWISECLVQHLYFSSGKPRSLCCPSYNQTEREREGEKGKQRQSDSRNRNGGNFLGELADRKNRFPIDKWILSSLEIGQFFFELLFFKPFPRVCVCVFGLLSPFSV